MRDFQDFSDAVPFCSPSRITAWDPVRQKAVWQVDHVDPVPGGLLATAGDLIFQGNGSGVFSAFDAHSGRELWHAEVGVGIMAPPVTYSVDGTQYVAVLAGLGGSHGGHFTKLVNMNEGRILAFKLGGSASLPKVTPRPAAKIDVPAQSASVESIDRGRDLYARNCLACHGVGAESSGLHPDLRFSERAVFDTWNDIVLGGTKQNGGMASFADQLTVANSGAIRAYVVSRALHEPEILERLARWVGRFACVPASWMAD